MNFIFLFGRLQKSIDERTRYLEVTRPESCGDAENLMIPCRYWTLTNNCVLTSINEGTLVSIRGRIECDDVIGIYVLVEQVVVLR